jgi:hypothetical protein
LIAILTAAWSQKLHCMLTIAQDSTISAIEAKRMYPQLPRRGESQVVALSHDVGTHWSRAGFLSDGGTIVYAQVNQLSQPICLGAMIAGVPVGYLSIAAGRVERVKLNH